MTNNKDYLSQEEIDALLRQSAEVDSVGGSGFAPKVEDYLSSLEQDALGEIGNITFGSAATALSTLLGKKVDITTPKVSVIAREELIEEFPKPHVAVHVNYVDGFHGINLLVIKTRDAQVIADLMMGGDGTGQTDELSEIHISAVQEAMNQMMGSSATSMSTIFNRFVNISPPGIDILNLSEGEGTAALPPEEVFIKVSFRLTIGDLIDSTIMQLLPVPFAKDMVSILMGGGEFQEETVAEPPAPSAPPAPAAPAPEPYAQHADHKPVNDYYSAPPAQQPPPYGQPSQQPMYGQPPQQPPVYQQPMYGQPPMPPNPQAYPSQPAAYGMPDSRNVNVQPAQFTNFTPTNLTPAEDTNLNLLLDIPLKVTVELGRTHKVIKDILELSQGSIIELDKLAGEPVDILVNNKLIAKGEVVVIDENFGVRVTDIVNQWDRIQKLQY
ncbi:MULTISPECIES: flagellar motor switch phosphatase FliY [Paenibacillus]|uniref:Flagellar motor switch protein FliN n=1 Tax=Paenibacillus naphthalenovorans TaxID=162209 RepID=A0A0U2UEL1_9BACL|nr:MULTISPECIES: flagellar motor switch phosphatase FliY [Paenibacillus]ALS21644.1 flagellar motor switch protein FliN [Paenibacillus naphthalenovorans]NTZ18202.1 flagellar motor switch phosphatase FliY [Paenibacillus sp. JMULE4]GCL71372.1 flagellar motor switch phosphatase FliY [Paenibacillus naphthalenovorans]SDI87389.1 flagellar motor switch protein FliN/FliY [Paenibacillus naphthalenovorans]